MYWWQMTTNPYLEVMLTKSWKICFDSPGDQLLNVFGIRLNRPGPGVRKTRVRGSSCCVWGRLVCEQHSEKLAMNPYRCSYRHTSTCNDQLPINTSSICQTSNNFNTSTHFNTKIMNMHHFNLCVNDLEKNTYNNISSIHSFFNTEMLNLQTMADII